jgi:hypothetical protein
MDIYKCPFLKNPKYFWKKRFTSLTSASAPPILGGLPLWCGCVRTEAGQWDHYAHVWIIAAILQKMGWKLGNIFFNNIGMAIFGDVSDFIFRRITFYPPFSIHIYWNILRILNSGHFSENDLPKKIRFMSQKRGSLFSTFSHFVYTHFWGIFWKMPEMGEGFVVRAGFKFL